MKHFIIVLIIAYFIWWIIAKYIFPIIIKKKIKKFQENIRHNQNPIYKSDNFNKEGDISIQYTNQKKAHPTVDSGEYIDYEEIKE